MKTIKHLFWALLVLCQVSLACELPVFRYALENWNPNQYRIEVFISSKSLSSDMEKSVSELKDNKAVKVLVQDMPGDASAYMDVYLPDQSQAALSKIPFTQAKLEALLNSPVRNQLRDKILNGQSVVWLQILSSKASENAEVQKLLESSFEQAQKTLKLAEDIENDEDLDKTLKTQIPLQIAFDYITLDPKDPREELFLKLLMSSEEGLTDYQDTPILFPLFGRGRSLYPCLGKGITYENIMKDLKVICSKCSCTIKDQNPGFDILLNVNWKYTLGDMIKDRTKALPPLTGIIKQENIVSLEKAEPIYNQRETSTNKPKAQPESQRDSLLAGLSLLSLFAIAYFILKK